MLAVHESPAAVVTSDFRSSSSSSTDRAHPSAGASTQSVRRSARLAKDPPPVSADVPRLPSSSGTYDLAALSHTLPAGHDSDRELERERAVAPSASGSHSSCHSTPIQAQRAAASGERAPARAERISKALKMKREFSPALEDYFFNKPTQKEMEDRIWPTVKIGTEEALAEVIAGITRNTRDPRLVACKNSPHYIGVAPDRVETTEKTADVVLLTHAAIAHDPTLPSVWALPSHADQDANVNVNVNANVNGQGQRKDEDAEEDDDDDDDEEGEEGKNKAEAKVDLNQAKRSFTHVAAVGETKAGEADAEKQLFRRLSALLATPIREYAIGFTLRGNRLRIYILNACGVFYTKPKLVTKDNGFLSTFLYRLVSHSDRLNGLLATTTSLDDRQGPFTLCEGFFPPAAPEFVGGPAAMSNVTVDRLLFRRQRECGRATSTYKITVGDGADVKTHAMTITWVEKSRNSDLAEIRNFIQAESPPGLARLVGVFRGEYETLPAFFGSNQASAVLVPRAKEVVVHEECYDSLDTLENSKELACVLEGAIQGHRALWNRGFIHRDVSHGNVMVDRHGVGVLIDYHLAVKRTRSIEEACRLSRSGTLPFLSRLLLRPRREGVMHERWHDIESFFYVAAYTAFRSGPFDAPTIEKTKAVRIWNMWNAEDPDDAASKKGWLLLDLGFQELHEACASRWSCVEAVLRVLQQNCSLAWSFTRLGYDKADNELLKLWDSEAMGYEQVIEGLKAFHRVP